MVLPATRFEVNVNGFDVAHVLIAIQLQDHSTASKLETEIENKPLQWSVKVLYLLN